MEAQGAVSSPGAGDKIAESHLTWVLEREPGSSTKAVEH